MLGPASREAEGSYEWAECYGNELDYHEERLAEEVDHFAEIIGKLAAADPPPVEDFFPIHPAAQPMLSPAVWWHDQGQVAAVLRLAVTPIWPMWCVIFDLTNR